MHIWHFCSEYHSCLAEKQIIGSNSSVLHLCGIAVKEQKHLSDYAAAHLQRSVQYLRIVGELIHL